MVHYFYFYTTLKMGIEINSIFVLGSAEVGGNALIMPKKYF